MWHCAECGHRLGSARENCKAFCLVGEKDPRAVYPPKWGYGADVDWCVLREFYCSHCTYRRGRPHGGRQLAGRVGLVAALREQAEALSRDRYNPSLRKNVRHQSHQGRSRRQTPAQPR